MIAQACADLDLDPARSWMVGDKWLDVRCGRAAGAGAILVKTGYGWHEAAAPPEDLRADAILDNLMEAVGWILRTSTSR
jgi:D-glycero-D-manno-heptose 1,7-bisphosphate phosphatase